MYIPYILKSVGSIGETMFWKKEPKFRIKIKQNRYEKFIIDELAVSGNTPNELIADLVEALEKATLQMEEMNGVKE